MRKCTTGLNFLLMKEQTAASADVLPSDKITQSFVSVAEQFKFKKTVLVPWNTGAKNCKDRFKHFIDKWESADRVVAVESGGVEKFGEY